jgi:tetratricopeptide (TPR) repeat protein
MSADKEKQKLAEEEKVMGNKLLQAKNYTAALEHYTKSVETFPESGTYSNMALAYLKMQMFDNAIEASTKSLQHNPTNFKAFFRRGEAYFYQKNYQKAYEDYCSSDKIESTEETKKAIKLTKEELDKIPKLPKEEFKPIKVMEGQISEEAKTIEAELKIKEELV